VSEIQVKEVPEFTAVTVEFTGSYTQTQDRLDYLMSWLLRVGHPFCSAPLAFYYDDPEKVPEDELRAEVCLPVGEEAQAADDVKVRKVPAASVAFATHTGAYSDIPAVYQEIFAWMGENGYRHVEGEPTREVFHRMHGQVESSAEFVTEVQVPVEEVAEQILEEVAEEAVEEAEEEVVEEAEEEVVEEVVEEAEEQADEQA
jgi:AraC family transcriptional regulator